MSFKCTVSIKREVNQKHELCPLYRVCPLIRGSVIRSFTVFHITSFENGWSNSFSHSLKYLAQYFMSFKLFRMRNHV